MKKTLFILLAVLTFADCSTSVRREQLGESIHSHNIPARYYQDFGWPTVELTNY